MKFLLSPLLIFVLFPSCSNWHYDAEFTENNGVEKIDFKADGYDFLYGVAHLYPYSIAYPKSARDVATNTVQASDFSSFLGEKPTQHLSGYLVVDPDNSVEVRLAKKESRTDGSSYATELPINGKYKLKIAK